MNWRRTGAAAALAAGALLCGAAGAAAQVAGGQVVKGFRLPEYDEEGRLVQQLYGETATFLEDGIIQLTGLKIEVFSRGEVAARIYSPECAYDPDRKRAASKEHIRIITEQAVLTGDGFAWNGTNEQFQIFKNAKVTLAAGLDAGLLEGPDAAEEPADTPAEPEPEE